jgi:hypothetical protein
MGSFAEGIKWVKEATENKIDEILKILNELSTNYACASEFSQSKE